MQEITIEKGIPIPPMGRPTSPLYAAIAQMKVGDSFAWKLHSLPRNLFNVVKRLEIKISTRTVTEKGIRRTRVWRVK